MGSTRAVQVTMQLQVREGGDTGSGERVGRKRFGSWNAVVVHAANGQLPNRKKPGCLVMRPFGRTERGGASPIPATRTAPRSAAAHGHASAAHGAALCACAAQRSAPGSLNEPAGGTRLGKAQWLSGAARRIPCVSASSAAAASPRQQVGLRLRRRGPAESRSAASGACQWALGAGRSRGRAQRRWAADAALAFDRR